VHARLRIEIVRGRSLVLVSASFVGCGSVGELLGVVTTDSGGMDVGSLEAGGPADSEGGNDASTCDPAKPFGVPVLLAELESGAAEGGLRLLPDELTGFFWSTRPGGPGTANLYVTRRSDRTSPFGGITLLGNVNSSVSQIDPGVVASGLTLVFRSNRAGGAGGDDLYSAARASVAADFSNVTSLSTLNSASNDVQPFLTPDGSEIYFASNRTGDYDIYRAALDNGMYGAPSAVAELNETGVDDADPVISADGLTMFFSSTRPGGVGAADIWMAARSAPASAFGPPVNVTELNSTSQDDPTWLSVDGCRLYMSVGDMPSTHLYLATRPM
jgi:Tol biopolymer transport system component